MQGEPQGGPFDIADLVNRVADRFEKQSKAKVTEGARYELISPALSHMDEFKKKRATGEVTIPQLESAIFAILQHAHGIALRGGQSVVVEGAIKKSMEDECPILFWC